ncbi:MAG: hypothetical protein JWN72_2456 [Thermoleophilia bacterium]|nr:hypothetical protein [Thermoleophilia bacterium]
MSVAASSAHPIGGHAPTRAPGTVPTTSRVDALALAVGTKLTASALLIGALVVLIVGAQSLLGAMQSMDRDIAEMNRQLVTANEGLVTLDTTMAALPKTSRHVTTILKTVQGTGREVKVSSAGIASTAAATTDIAAKLDTINESTAAMRASHVHASEGTDQLGTIVSSLQVKLAPLVKQQHTQYLQTKRMSDGLDNMNDSLAYIIRALNYMTEPDSGGSLKIKAELTKETMPKIPGLKIQADPISVFERGAFPLYTGP